MPRIVQPTGKPILSCYAAIYRYNHQYLQWMISGDGGWSEVYLWKDSGNKQYRITAKSTKQSRIHQLSINCILTSKCGYKQKSNTFHVFYDQYGTRYGLGFHDSPKSQIKAKKMMDSISTIIKAYRLHIIDQCDMDIMNILQCDHNTKMAQCPQCKTKLPLLQFIPPSIQQRKNLFTSNFSMIEESPSLPSSKQSMSYSNSNNVSSKNNNKMNNNNNNNNNNNMTAHYIWSIGYNHYGQQGNGTTKSMNKLSLNKQLPDNIYINHISCNDNGSTFILYNDSKLIVFGDNKYGQLSINHEIFKMILQHWYNKRDTLLNDVINVMILFIDDFNFVSKILLPFCMNTYHVKYISNGIASQHRFIVTNDDMLYGTGKNTDNQLCIKQNSQNNNHEIYNFRQIDYFNHNKIKLKQIECAYKYTTFLSSKGVVYASNQGNIPQIVEMRCIKTKIIQIANGKNHSLALDANNHIYSWGSNQNGQCGYPADIASIQQPKLIQYLLKNRIQIDKIATGPAHNVVIDLHGKVYCWGYNYYYQCGNGGNDNVYIPQRNETLNNIEIIDVKCGGFHNVARSIHNEYFLWGSNDYNQCLIYNDRDNETECIKIPTKYNPYNDLCDEYEIISIYPGHSETRVITKLNITI